MHDKQKAYTHNQRFNRNSKFNALTHLETMLREWKTSPCLSSEITLNWLCQSQPKNKKMYLQHLSMTL